MKTLLLVSLLLTSCATYDGYDWTRSGRPSLPVQWYVAGQEGVKARCHQYAGMTTNACAIYGAERCVIVAEVDEAHTPKWLADHERKHCAGWDHG